MVKRFDVYLINLDDQISKDAKNTRPAVVISPDEANRNLGHVTIAPLSATNAKYPTRVSVEFLKAERFIILDQIRAVEKERLVKKIGEVEKASHGATLGVLQEMFAE